MAAAVAFEGLPWTVERFDQGHAQQPERWELILGEPVVMQLRTLRHTIIKGNVLVQLANGVARGGWRAYVSGPEVKERGRRLSAVPDVVVERKPLDLSSSEVKEPVVVVEVLPPSHERDDTGRKWRGYRLIPSLQHYLAVEQDERRVSVHTRIGPSSFAEREHRSGMIELPAVGASLTFDATYEDVDLAEPGYA